MKLAAARVYRAGRTARRSTCETDRVELNKWEGKGIGLKFSLSSKGGGITEVSLIIGADDFADIISAMTTADRGQTMRAMASKLATEIENQPAYDMRIIQEARQSVVDAAECAYM